jgi:hypothetical protein
MDGRKKSTAKHNCRLTMRLKNNMLTTVILALAMSIAIAAQAGEGKLLATPGVIQLEGSGGSGIVPWATLAGYASQDEIAVSAFATRVSVEDYRLSAWGAAVNLYDRVELSVASQNFELRASGAEISQDIFGVKARVAGNLVYSALPQVAVGVQHKRLNDGDIAAAVGADDAKSGTDVYITASKLHLGAAYGYNVLWTLAARATKANQMGLLGFGGDKDDSYSVQLEASAVLLLSRQLAIGFDYRQKPDNLGFAKEQRWKDYFIAYVPNKHINLTLAYVDLGSIAGQPSQTGTYVSLTGYLW